MKQWLNRILPWWLRPSISDAEMLANAAKSFRERQPFAWPEAPADEPLICTTGSNNIAFGRHALAHLTTGHHNVFIGHDAGESTA